MRHHIASLLYEPLVYPTGIILAGGVAAPWLAFGWVVGTITYGIAGLLFYIMELADADVSGVRGAQIIFVPWLWPLWLYGAYRWNAGYPVGEPNYLRGSRRDEGIW